MEENGHDLIEVLCLCMEGLRKPRETSVGATHIESSASQSALIMAAPTTIALRAA
jgi:hypothetical protein